MVRLEKIKKTRNSVTCDVFLEDSAIPVPVMYSFTDKTLAEYSLPAAYSWCTTHMTKVEIFLSKLEKEAAIPKSKTIMWY